jgi:hypothetical protein
MEPLAAMLVPFILPLARLKFDYFFTHVIDATTGWYFREG